MDKLKLILIIYFVTLFGSIIGVSGKPPSKAVMSMFKSTRLCPGFETDEGPPFRYHEETKRCYKVGDKGPCPDLMAFVLLDENYGTCDCDQKSRCGRPLIYWPQTKRCYYVNDQGPCSTGKWLVFGFNLQPQCKTNRCLTHQRGDPGKGGRFWFSFQGGCFKTYTQGYCKEGEILFNNFLEYRPTCNKVPKCGQMPMVHSMSCLPGSKKDYEGNCKRKFIHKL